MPLPEPDPRLCRALAADLDAADYRPGTIRARWGSAAEAAFGRAPALVLRRAIGADQTAIATVTALFGLGEAMPTHLVGQAFPTCGLDGLVRLGLVATGDGQVTPELLVRAQDVLEDERTTSWWIASDLDEQARRGPLPEDHVLGVGGASLTLAGLQVPDPAGDVLDVGAGCGIQSLCARRTAERVVATDLSQRALTLTRLNASLNDVTAITTRAGDMFAPVHGELFDRVVSNPPFVITPRTDTVPTYEYRDGGRAGDDLVAEFIRGVGAHLRPGGTAQLLGNWESREGEPGLDRVRGWVESSPVALDAWVVERESLDPLAYAQLWIRDAGVQPGTAPYDRLLQAWLDDFDTRSVLEVGLGYIVLRRSDRPEPALARYERLTQPVAESALGAHIARSLAAHDRVEALSDAQLEASTLVVADDVTEARHLRPGADSPQVIELRQGGGFARTVAVDAAVAALVGACDGDLPVGSLLAAIAQLLEVDADALRAQTLPVVRELVFTGMLGFAEVGVDA